MLNASTRKFTRQPRPGTHSTSCFPFVNTFSWDTSHCRGLDVTPIMLSLGGAAAYPRACQALASMLSRQALNPADITVVCPSAFPSSSACTYYFYSAYMTELYYDVSHSCTKCTIPLIHLQLKSSDLHSS